jgi:hypothetical protein
MERALKQSEEKYAEQNASGNSHSGRNLTRTLSVDSSGSGGGLSQDQRNRIAMSKAKAEKRREASAALAKEQAQAREAVRPPPPRSHSTLFQPLDDDAKRRRAFQAGLVRSGEFQAIVDTELQPGEMLKIQACAGAGKVS